MGEGETTIEGYLDSADTRSTLAAVAALGAEVEGVGATAIEPGDRDPRRRPARRRAGGDRRRQRRHPAAPAAGLAGRAAGGELDARRRRLDPPPAGRPVAEPLRLMGAELELPRGPPAAAAGRGRPLRGHRVRAAGRQRPGQVVPALRRPAGRGRDQGRRAAAEPRPHRADARRRGRRGRPRRRRRVTVRPAERLEPGEIAVPGDFSSAAFFIVAALLVPGSEVALDGRRPQPDPHRAARRSSSGWAPRSRSSEGERGGEPIGDAPRPPARAARRPRSAAPRCRWRSTSCRWSRSPPASPRARRRSATPRSCAARSPTGSPPSARR